MKAMVTTKFDYANSPAELRKITNEIRDHFKSSTRGILEVGNRLIEVKVMLEHGKFCEWLGVEFGLSERTAQNMMAAATYCKSAKFADLEVPASALYLLAADTTPEEVRDRFTSRIQAGEPVTHKEVAAAVQKVKVRRVQPALPNEIPTLAADADSAEVIADAKLVTAAVEPAQLAKPDQPDHNPELRATSVMPGRDEPSKSAAKTNPERAAAGAASASTPIDVVTAAIDRITTALADLPRLIEAVPATDRSGFHAAIQQMLQPTEAICKLVREAHTPGPGFPGHDGRKDKNSEAAVVPAITKEPVAAETQQVEGTVKKEGNAPGAAVVAVKLVLTKGTIQGVKKGEGEVGTDGNQSESPGSTTASVPSSSPVTQVPAPEAAIQPAIASITATALTHEQVIAEIKRLGGDATRDADGSVVGVLLPRAKIGDAELMRWKGLNRVRHLDLYATKITDAGLEHLQGWTDLSRLILNSTAVTDAGLVHLHPLEKLQTVHLAGTKVTLAGVKKLQEVLPQCHITH